MLKSSKQTKVSFHAELYSLIPEDHLLRQINDVVDFSFIHDLVEESYCIYYGRPANEPELLFRLLFLQFLYNLSDERLIKECQVNLAYKWFLGLNPEDNLPDPSQISRFRIHRLGANRVEKVLENLVRQCVELNLLKSKVLLIDSTHTLANTQKQPALDVLKDAAKRLHRAVLKRHPQIGKKLPHMPKLSGEKADQEKTMLHYLADLGEKIEGLLPDAEGAVREKLEIAKRIVEDERFLAHKGIQSAIDPDARIGWKSNTKSFFGYKEHLAMSEEEIITAVVVTHGAADDGKQLPHLFTKTIEDGVGVQEVLADTAYSGSVNLKLLQSENVVATIPLNPSVYSSNEHKEDGFIYVKDADAVQCPAGHLSIRKAKQGKKNAGANQNYTYYFDTDKCKSCPLRDGCYKPGARTKTYSIRILSDHHTKQIEYTQSADFQTRKRRRNRIEHKNAELKRHHGMIRARYRGLFGMMIQAFLTAFAVNVKRMIKLLNEEKRTSYGEVRFSFYLFT